MDGGELSDFLGDEEYGTDERYSCPECNSLITTDLYEAEQLFWNPPEDDDLPPE